MKSYIIGISRMKRIGRKNDGMKKEGNERTGNLGRKVQILIKFKTDT